MHTASCDFVMLSLDASRQVEEQLKEGKPATALSALDHYTSRPATSQSEKMTLLHFVQHYSMPRNVGEELVARKKMVVVRVRPYCSPDTSGPQYDQYCQQKLMLRIHLNEIHSKGCPHVEAKQLAAHQTLPALQLLAQLLGKELLAQNYCSVAHYRAPHFVQNQVQCHFHR